MTAVIKLGDALGCARPLADQLLDERLLLPISNRPSFAAGRQWKGVDNREIDRFLAALQADVRLVDAIPTGMVPIAKAAEKAKLLGVEIVHLILGGFLTNVATLRKGIGCSAIVVDPAEVRSQSHAVLVGMSAFAAFSRLKIPKASGWALVERQDGPRLDPVIIEGRTNQHRIHRFTDESIASFMSEFITDVRVANAFDVQKRIAVGHLKKRGIRPAVPYAEIGIYLYRTSHVPELEVS